MIFVQWVISTVFSKILSWEDIENEMSLGSNNQGISAADCTVMKNITRAVTVLSHGWFTQLMIQKNDPCCVNCFQAAALFPRTSSPGRDHVQREHEALTAQDAVRQVPKCPCGDQPRGSHYLHLSVTHGVSGTETASALTDWKNASVWMQLNSLQCHNSFKIWLHCGCINVCRFTKCRKCFYLYEPNVLFTILNYFVHIRKKRVHCEYLKDRWGVGSSALTTEGHAE